MFFSFLTAVPSRPCGSDEKVEDDSMCGSKRQRGPQLQNKSIFVSDWNHIFTLLARSLSLFLSLSLVPSPSCSQTSQNHRTQSTSKVQHNTHTLSLHILFVSMVTVSLLAYTHTFSPWFNVDAPLLAPPTAQM